MGNIYPH